MPSDFQAASSMAIDTETMGLNTQRDRLCLVQISNGDGDAHLVQLDGQNYQAPNLKKILENKDILKIFHYARFDIAALEYYLEIKMANFYCTKIASKLARTYTEFHGLKDICNELAGVNISKTQQSSNWSAAKLTEAQKKYAAQDVLYLHQIKEKLDIILAQTGRADLAKSCFDFLSTRVQLDLEGWLGIDIFKH